MQNMFHTPTAEKSHLSTPIHMHREAVKAVLTICRNCNWFFLWTTERHHGGLGVFWVVFFLQFKAGDDSKVAAAASAATSVCPMCVCVC